MYYHTFFFFFFLFQACQWVKKLLIFIIAKFAYLRLRFTQINSKGSLRSPILLNGTCDWFAILLRNYLQFEIKSQIFLKHVIKSRGLVQYLMFLLTLSMCYTLDYFLLWTQRKTRILSLLKPGESDNISGSLLNYFF